MSQPINVGLIGCGFMGRTHSNAYRKVYSFFKPPYKPVLKAICDMNADKANAFAEAWDFESVETDWKKLIRRPDIDLIDICTPNNTHREIAIAAAEAGKMIICEKPLAMNTAEGEQMVAAVEKAGVPNLVSFNYRRVPAVTLAKQLIDEGRLGRIFHYRAVFLQDWTISADLPQGGDALWRLDAKVAGSGVTGDLLAHCIDTAIWLNGPIRKVTAMTETFIKQRKHNITGQVEAVEIDDACAFLARFENGSLATFESTRYARGHKAHVTDSDMPYMDKWWVPGLQIGYEHTFVHQVADFLEGVAQKRPVSPTFRDALETQKVCDAVLASAKSGTWVDIA